jgi:hypothetical protein
MALIFLTYIFYAGGVVAIIYLILALLSLMNHARLQKGLPDKYEPSADMTATSGPSAAEAFWGRTKILLQNEQFDAAFADCKRTLEINPNHAEAKSCWTILKIYFSDLKKL